MRVNENILVSSLTTMRFGGPARYVLEVERPSEVTDAYGFADAYGLPTFVMGYAMTVAFLVLLSSIACAASLNNKPKMVILASPSWGVNIGMM